MKASRPGWLFERKPNPDNVRTPHFCLSQTASLPLLSHLYVALFAWKWCVRWQHCMAPRTETRPSKLRRHPFCSASTADYLIAVIWPACPRPACLAGVLFTPPESSPLLSPSLVHPFTLQNKSNHSHSTGRRLAFPNPSHPKAAPPPPQALPVPLPLISSGLAPSLDWCRSPS